MTYTPQPGTIPHRVIEFLKQHPHGAEFSGAEIADAIGHDGAALTVYLSNPVDRGALKVDKRVPPHGGHKVNYYSLGDGIPLPKADDDVDEPLHKPLSAPALAPAEEIPARSKPANPHQAAQTLSRAVFGWFSDGSLVIRQSGAADIQLSQEDTDDLVKFIRQVRG